MKVVSTMFWASFVFLNFSVFAYDRIDIQEHQLEQKYPGFDQIVIRNFDDTRHEFYGLVAGFSLLSHKEENQHYFAKLASDEGRITILVLTSESCDPSERGLKPDNIPAFMSSVNNQSIWFAKKCSGQNYYLQPIDSEREKLVHEFLNNEWVTIGYDHNLFFDTTGFEKTIKALTREE